MEAREHEECNSVAAERKSQVSNVHVGADDPNPIKFDEDRTEKRRLDLKTILSIKRRNPALQRSGFVVVDVEEPLSLNERRSVDDSNQGNETYEEPECFSLSVKRYNPILKSIGIKCPILKSIDTKCSEFTGPLYKQHQLLGDSQLMRFSTHLLGYKQETEYKGDRCTRRVGYCVSGQRIDDLNVLLRKHNYDVGDKVIVMIGTNDLLRGGSHEKMCSDYDNILNNLRTRCSRVVLVTIPPIPRLGKGHLTELRSFNEFIVRKGDGWKVRVVDLCGCLIDDENINMECFEKVYGQGPKVDKVHLNEMGFHTLRGVLNRDYFDVCDL